MTYEKLVTSIDENWQAILEETAKVTENYNQQPVKIVAVSKTRSLEEIHAAYDVGIRRFGENYAQELMTKAQAFPDPEWHFIGHLQRGNVKGIIDHVDFIHSVDSIKLLNRLDFLNYSKKCLIQVNISAEESKSGVENRTDKISQLLDHAKSLKVNIVGFMAMGGFNWEKDEIRSNFNKFVDTVAPFGLSEISLGMSRDFPEAIEFGSTFIRIGTKIFGKR